MLNGPIAEQGQPTTGNHHSVRTQASESKIIIIICDFRPFLYSSYFQHWLSIGYHPFWGRIVDAFPAFERKAIASKGNENFGS